MLQRSDLPINPINIGFVKLREVFIGEQNFLWLYDECDISLHNVTNVTV